MRKEKSGITLIALVITIIVLLLLAGISITMLTGDNSILNQAVNAKEKTIEANRIEEIELAYIGLLAKYIGDDERIIAEELAEELEKNADTDVTVENLGNDLKITYGANDEFYLDKASGKAYSGDTYTPQQPETPKTPEEIKEENIKKATNIGKKVSYVAKYSNDLIWRLFYADDQYVYLISSDKDGLETVSTKFSYQTSKGMNPFSNHAENYPNGSEEITDTFLRSLNSKWYTAIGQEGSTTASAKAVAWLMDQNVWKNFKDEAGVATYAIGGPTVELLAKSYNETAQGNGQTPIDSITIVNGGYDANAGRGRLQHTYNNGIYHLDGESESFWLASPGGNNANEGSIGKMIRTSGGNPSYSTEYGMYFGEDFYGLGLRPVAILPMSAYIASNYEIVEE